MGAMFGVWRSSIERADELINEIMTNIYLIIKKIEEAYQTNTNPQSLYVKIKPDVQKLVQQRLGNLSKFVNNRILQVTGKLFDEEHVIRLTDTLDALFNRQELIINTQEYFDAMLKKGSFEAVQAFHEHMSNMYKKMRQIRSLLGEFLKYSPNEQTLKDLRDQSFQSEGDINVLSEVVTALDPQHILKILPRIIDHAPKLFQSLRRIYERAASQQNAAQNQQSKNVDARNKNILKNPKLITASNKFKKVTLANTITIGDQDYDIDRIIQGIEKYPALNTEFLNKVNETIQKHETFKQRFVDIMQKYIQQQEFAEDYSADARELNANEFIARILQTPQDYEDVLQLMKTDGNIELLLHELQQRGFVRNTQEN